MYVCHCNSFNCRKVKEAISDGARTPAQVFRHQKARPQCGRCMDTVRDILKLPVEKCSKASAT